MKREPDVVSSAKPSKALCLLSDGVVLLLLLGGMLFSVQSAYQIDVDFLDLAGICVALTVLMLIFYGLRRGRGLVMLLLLLVYAAVAWYRRYNLVAGACMTVEQAFTALELPFQMDATWLGGTRRDVVFFLTMAAALLSVPIGWTVIRGRSGVLAMVLTAPWVLPALFLDVFPNWAALMAMVAGWCVLLVSGRAGREDAAGGARMTLVSLPVVAALLLILTAALPRENYERPAWADMARMRLEETASGISTDGSSLVGQALSLLSGGDQVSVSLENAGPRTYQDRVVLEVESDYEGRVYLRGTSSAVYTGSEWEPLSDTVYASIGLSDDTIYDPLRGYEPLNFPSLTATSMTPYYEMNITYPSSLAGWMYTPYQLVTTPDEISDVTFEDDSHLERRFGIREKNLYFMPDALPASVISPYKNWEAAQAEANYRQFVYEHYLDVPEGFEAIRTEWLARADTLMLEQYGISISDLNGGYRAPLWSPTTVAGLLALTTEYDLNTPYTLEGEDFVDYFLNESHRGYCVHYATAGTLLLRSFGIPARYVTGYTVEIPASGKAEVLDSDAHAWVEMYVDGYGWYPVEMTPASGTGIDNIAPMVQAPDLDEPDEEPEEVPEQEEEPDEPLAEQDQPKPETTPSEMPETPSDPPKAPTADEQGGRNWSYWVILIAVALTAVVIRRLIHVGLWKKRFSSADRNRAVIAAYDYLKRLEPFGANPDSVLGKVARKAKFSQHKLTEEERVQAIALAVEERKRVESQLPAVRRWWVHWILGL